MGTYYRVLLVLVVTVCLWSTAVAQYPRSSDKYQELMDEGQEELAEFLETNPYYEQETPPPDPTASIAETQAKPYRCWAGV